MLACGKAERGMGKECSLKPAEIAMQVNLYVE
jgi:hypothetical protein